MADQRKRINDLLEPYSARVQAAFNAAIADITAQAEINKIIRALEANDIRGALEAVHVSPDAFAEFEQALSQTFLAGGQRQAANLAIDFPGNRFQLTDTRAEQWLSQYSSTLVKEIVDDQLIAIRETLVDGLQKGQGPRETALGLVGRINRATGRRSGGTIGLASSQAAYVRNARDQLLAGDPASLRAYLGRQLRDKRYDKRVLKAIITGQPIPRDVINRMVAAYNNSMLKFRAVTIGRTETMTSLHAAQHAANMQLVDSGKIQRHQLRRIWRTASDLRVRDSHSAMEGQSVGIDETFVSGHGIAIMYPGDPAAPANERIACRCDVETRIDFMSNLPG